MSCYYSIPYYPTLSLILVHNPITPKIKALAIPPHMSSAGRRPGYFPFFADCPVLVVYTNSSIESALLQYCPAANAKCFKYYKTAKNLPSVHTAQEKKKELSNLPDPRQYSVSQTRVAPFPPSSLPLRKSSNIYIFNPIKNVKKKYN